jgi:arabinoxylan arabinofuranohydrolase
MSARAREHDGTPRGGGSMGGVGGADPAARTLNSEARPPPIGFSDNAAPAATITGACSILTVANTQKPRLSLSDAAGWEKLQEMTIGKPSNESRFVFAALLFWSLTGVAPAARADNPIVQTNYTADPAPMLYDGRLYVYTSHDEDVSVNNFFTMNDWRLYSTVDMVNWTDHGSPASYRAFSWGTGDAWAPHGVPRNGKFYLYVPLNNSTGSKIGVGVANNPAGPFTDALGKALISTGGGNIDPTVFIDDDQQAYLYWGNPDLWYVKLNADMISYSGSPTKVSLTTAGFGTRSNSDRATAYEEGPWFYKKNSLYYLVYPADGTPEKISYSTSSGPLGPWMYRGDIMAKESGTGSSFTNHPGVIDYKGHSFFFYHNGALPGGGGYKRSVCVEQFTYGSDGTIPTIKMTTAGPNPVENLNPYQQVEAETIAFSAGLKTETCSEGGIDVTQISNGDYIKVRSVDFGTGATSFDARVASAGSGGNIELRLDSQMGMLLGTCSVSGTGGAQTWTTKSCAVSGATGVHDLFFRFTGGSGGNLFSFNWWKFTPRDPMGGMGGMGGMAGAGGMGSSGRGGMGGTAGSDTGGSAGSGAAGGGAPMGGTSGVSMGGSSAGGASSSGTSGTGGMSAAAGSFSASGGTSPAGAAGTQSFGGGTPSSSDDSSGCGCTVPGRRGERPLAALVALLLVASRRRHGRRQAVVRS